MTAKRFEAKTIPADKRADWVVGVFDNGVLINNFGVVRLLNELAEENEKLKEDNKILNRINDKVNGWNGLAHEKIFKLEKENEQLKQDKDLFAQCICDLSNLLYDNKIEHKLPKDIKDFITVWGVRVE